VGTGPEYCRADLLSCRSIVCTSIVRKTHSCSSWVVGSSRYCSLLIVFYTIGCSSIKVAHTPTSSGQLSLLSQYQSLPSCLFKERYSDALEQAGTSTQT